MSDGKTENQVRATSENYPQPDANDRAVAMLRGAVASLPGVGGFTGELYNLVITVPLEERRTQWFVSLAEQVQELIAQNQDLTLEDLVDSTVFTTAVVQAITIAVRNHEEEKLAALRNAVLNTALSLDANEDERQFLFNMIDELTPIQLRMLHCCADLHATIAEYGLDPSLGTPEHGMVGATAVVWNALKFRTEDTELFNALVEDLRKRGLGGNVYTPGNYKDPPHVWSANSVLGARLLALITSPLNAD